MMVKDQRVQTGVFCFEVTTGEIDVEGDMRYTTYGVKALKENDEVVAHYPDVSTDRDLVAEIVRKCNENQVDVLHLKDILLDHIG